MSKLLAPLEKKDAGRYHFLLWLRFLVANMFFSGVFALAFLMGWVDEVFAKEADVTWFGAFTTFNIKTIYVAMMACVFLIGLVSSVRFVFRTSKEINYLKVSSFPPESSWSGEYLRQIDGVSDASRNASFEIFAEKWFNRIDSVKYLSAKMELLGFGGTILGFVIALSGINPDMVGDVSTFSPMVVTLIVGMRIAFYTTIAGVFWGSLWLSINARILHGGSVDFLSLLQKRGERQRSVLNVE